LTSLPVNLYFGQTLPEKVLAVVVVEQRLLQEYQVFLIYFLAYLLHPPQVQECQVADQKEASLYSVYQVAFVYPLLAFEETLQELQEVSG